MNYNLCEFQLCASREKFLFSFIDFGCYFLRLKKCSMSQEFPDCQLMAFRILTILKKIKISIPQIKIGYSERTANIIGSVKRPKVQIALSLR